MRDEQVDWSHSKYKCTAVTRIAKQKIAKQPIELTRNLWRSYSRAIESTCPSEKSKLS